jgi:hypothetical protein
MTGPGAHLLLRAGLSLFASEQAWDSGHHGVEQAFMPAVKLIEKSALAAEVPGPVCLEMKDALSFMGTPPPSAPGLALPDSARCSL